MVPGFVARTLVSAAPRLVSARCRRLGNRGLDTSVFKALEGSCEQRSTGSAARLEQKVQKRSDGKTYNR